jgi:hypothetical protein
MRDFSGDGCADSIKANPRTGQTESKKILFLVAKKHLHALVRFGFIRRCRPPFQILPAAE